MFLHNKKLNIYLFNIYYLYNSKIINLKIKNIILLIHRNNSIINYKKIRLLYKEILIYILLI